MDPSDVVLRKTGEGKGYYERCGAEAGVPALTSIFAMLSDDECRHAEALKAQRSGARVELSHSTTLEGARFLLRHLSVQDAVLKQFNGDLGTLGLAMDFEAASVRLYGRLAREAEHHWERDLFMKIAAEDEVHFTLLEQMREMLEYDTEDGQPADGVTDAD